MSPEGYPDVFGYGWDGGTANGTGTRGGTRTDTRTNTRYGTALSLLGEEARLADVGVLL